MPVLLLLVSYSSIAATLTVGVGKQHATITAAVNAAQPADTIEIDAGIYPNESMNLSKNGLTLRGVGGRAHLKWGTGNYLTNTATIGNGKAILVISGSNITIENLEFSGAKVVDQNGAGIRYEGGDLTIRGSYFHDNENGILGQGGAANTLLIENSIFERNGYCPVDCAHNVYIGNMGRFIFRFNKSVDSHIGHTLKSRALVTEVIGNYLSTKNGDGSYEADFPNGGTVYFIGNVIEQGVNTDNPQVLIYGEEGATNPNRALYIVNNTFVNLRGSGSYISASGSPTLTIRNNIFSGGTLPAGVDASNKLLPSSTFVSAATGDYRLAAGATQAIDAGISPGVAGTYDLTPLWQYVEPAGNVARVQSGAAIDIGAYEFASVGGTDTTPDAFGFTAQSGVAVSTAVTSNTITPAGYNAAAPISVSPGGSYSINGGAFTSAAGSISPGQTVAVRQTSSATFSTTSTMTLTIGGVAGTFAVTTQAAPPDTTPDAFGFTAQNGVAVSTVVTSNTLTPAGYNAAAPISVSAGGSYSINSGAFTSAAGSISPGQTVAVRQTSSAAFSTTSTVTLTIGGVAGTFAVTTQAAPPDTTPDAFGFTAQNGVAVSTAATSNTITPTGYTAAAPISVSAGGSYSINSGAFTSAAGSISPGQTVAVRQTSSATFSTTSTVTLTIGGVAGTFAVTTQAAPPDTTPDAFGFVAQNGVAVSAGVTSNTIIPAGYNAAAPISVAAGGSYSINGGGFTSAAGTITPGQNVAVRLVAAAGNGVQTCTTLNIGGTAGNFCVTTIAGLSGVPTAVTASSGAGSITVKFGAPVSDGGSAITGYSASCTSSDGGVANSNSGGVNVTALRVGGLSAGRTYTCTVKATNALGAGPSSAPSNPVKPMALAPILNLLLQD